MLKKILTLNFFKNQIHGPIGKDVKAKIERKKHCISGQVKHPFWKIT